jgi:hypothetical protein
MQHKGPALRAQALAERALIAVRQSIRGPTQGATLPSRTSRLEMTLRRHRLSGE